MIWHTESIYTGVPDECTCPRQECGAVIEATECEWHHPQRAGLHHRAEDCRDIQRRRAIRVAGNAAADMTTTKETPA